MVRIAQIFRMLRIIRLFRLRRFWKILRAKVKSADVCLITAEHMQKLHILVCFIRAHISSQKKIVKNFGNKGEVDSVEVSRCILQSQTFCYRAMMLQMGEKDQLSFTMLEQVRIAKEVKHVLRQCEGFVCDAHSHGIMSYKEADNIMHTLHDCIAGFTDFVIDVQLGRVDLDLDTETLLAHRQSYIADMLQQPHDGDNIADIPKVVTQISKFKDAPPLSALKGGKQLTEPANLASLNKSQLDFIPEEPMPEPDLEPPSSEDLPTMPEPSPPQPKKKAKNFKAAVRKVEVPTQHSADRLKAAGSIAAKASSRPAKEQRGGLNLAAQESEV